MTCPAGMQVGQVSQLLTAPGSGINYLTFLPKNWDAEGPKLPVLLFLHGAGGVNNEDNVRGQSLTKMLLTPEYATGVGHIVLIPIAPARDWPNFFDPVLGLVDMAIADLNGDPGRVALAGQSMGGHGAWMLAAKQPERFCAIVPICGYVPPRSGLAYLDLALGYLFGFKISALGRCALCVSSPHARRPAARHDRRPKPSV